MIQNTNNLPGPTGPRLLSLGECMIEVAPNPDGVSYRLGFAGDTFNTAWYARKLLPAEWSVSYLTRVGRDKTSDEFLEFCRSAGLCTRDIGRDDKKTMGLYRVHLDNGERNFSYWRSDSAARRMADDPAALRDDLNSATAIYFSGISIAILSTSARDTLYQALNTAKAQGKQIIFDTNLRPGLWPDPGTMTSEVARFAGLADLVLPSHDDEQVFYGDKTPKDTLDRYRNYGASVVVVKNGPAQILAAIRGKLVVEFAPDPVAQPVDTTAAGDSFNAGFLAGYLCGKSIETSLDQAARLAAKVICGPGALVDIDLEPDAAGAFDTRP